MQPLQALDYVYYKQTLTKLLRGYEDKTFRTVCTLLNNPNMPLVDALDQLYNIAEQSRRNEYYYQNQWFTQFAQHQTSVSVLRQNWAGRCVADLIDCERGEAIEIKSDLDSFARLEHQIAQYFTGFTHVSVLAKDEKIRELCGLLEHMPCGERVGVYAMHEAGDISAVREPRMVIKYLKQRTIYAMLHQKEVETLLAQRDPSFQPCNSYERYEHYYQKFSTTSVLVNQRDMTRIITERSRRNINAIKTLPPSVWSAAYFLPDKELQTLLSMST
ncbi:hypothetical protein GCM10007377_15370 [Galliscardovia ingluviei]|uniref:Sce7726 family protein n=1 Tax=Galliscardovia ingluviei TaxID=1769422 RepID=A0A8J3AR12_9BIFI|nr:sce7726 family protein [Galliscardovia ingluviei]GGI15332.1 hypothetical protein GCM10007377_15370 [Galliscardovia ingluviei]